jgi:hypothetical protein
MFLPHGTKAVISRAFEPALPPLVARQESLAANPAAASRLRGARV